MGLKKAVLRSIVIIVILALSVGIGLGYQKIWRAIDLKNHPREYSELVSEYASKLGVPEYVVYAVMKTESDFQSNKEGTDGAIGLMQITPERFARLLTMTKETKDTGILYDPETNIEYGTYYLSYLYTKYNRWDTVFAAYASDEDTVERWRDDPEYGDENRNLKGIPDEAVREYVDAVNKAIEVYKKLYYNE